MKKFIRTHVVEAKPMTLGAYNEYRGWEIPKDEDPTTEGYLVKYQDGYESWCPRDKFIENSMEIIANPKLTASDISISQEMVNDLMDRATYRIMTVGDKTTIVHCVLPNGFTLVESSSCVDPKNYNQELGAKICIDRMKNQVWSLLGFLLQTAVKGVR